MYPRHSLQRKDEETHDNHPQQGQEDGDIQGDIRLQKFDHRVISQRTIYTHNYLFSLLLLFSSYIDWHLSTIV